MILVPIFFGVLAGLIGFTVVLIQGASIWFALLIYSGVGSTVMVLALVRPLLHDLFARHIAPKRAPVVWSQTPLPDEKGTSAPRTSTAHDFAFARGLIAKIAAYV